ncbi:MAG: hypothetical protein R3293_00050 [Candidatus Promineifilaceae bacterium]|nr:hypothetical protein [Candidatus Promineifilaceae bacterium]
MRQLRLHSWLIVFLILLAATAACSGQASKSYSESFNNPSSWSTGDDAYTEGKIVDGVYDLLVKGDDVSRWASAGEVFKDGLYEVEATQVEGPLDNGFGMLLRANTDKGDFYLFKISGDGFVWIGRYRDEAEEQPIIGNHWFQSPAINQGLNQKNKLSVAAESGNMIFYVNDHEVGRVTDNSFAEGDIGLFAQTLGQGGVRVHFDNYVVSPIEK